MSSLRLIALLTVFLAFTTLSRSALAVTLTQTLSDTNLFQGHQMIQTATFTPDGQPAIALQPVAQGLRKKAVFGLVAVNVYVAQLLAAKPEKLVKTEDGILASLKEAGPVQLSLVFMRNIPGDRISESFKEGLAANKIDTKNLPPDLTNILKEIEAIKEFKNNGRFTLAFEWNADRSSVHLSDGSGPVKTVTGSAEFAGKLLSIWFGTPADAKLGELKKTLIK